MLKSRFMGLLAAGAFIPAITGAGAAADDKPKWRPDPARGVQLSRKLCASCHVVEANQSGTAIAGIPSFRAIANLPGRSEQYISNFLIQPHLPMPNVKLTSHEIADLLAYIAELRMPGASQSNTQPGNQKGGPVRSKQTYPSPS